jgi:uroporphyrinogen decarboxylase
VTGIERVKAAFRGKTADRVPFYPIVSALAGELVGVNAKAYYTDFDNLAETHLALFNEIGHDVLALMPDLFLEVDAMGAEVEFPADDVPRLRSYLLEAKELLGKLKIPDPEKDGRLPAYLEACRKVAGADTGSAVGAVLCGPWTLATNLRGAENLIIDTATDPDFVHELMDFTVGMVKRTGEAVKKSGVGLSLSEAPASLSLISPKIFRDFVAPYEKELISYLRERKISVTLHICGVIDPIMSEIASLGAIALSMDRPSSLGKMLEAAAGRMVVIGNVPTGIFVDGTEKDIEEEIKRCLAEAKGKPGFILATGCEISPRADLEKVKVFAKMASELGKL